MHPSKLAKTTEHSQQAALFAWAAVARLYGLGPALLWAYDPVKHPLPAAPAEPLGPECLDWMHAIPNGGSRGDTAASRRIAGGQMKAEGVRSGILDIFLPFPANGRHGLYIEMKVGDNTLSAQQAKFADYAVANGYSVWVCYNWLGAVEIIERYINQGVKNDTI